LKFTLNEYNNANRDLFMKLQASAIASEQPELMNKIFDLAGKLIREHGASEMSVYRDLSFSINAATVYQSLEETLAIKRQFRQPEILAEARLKATSPEGALAAIQKEQNDLADLHGNIKYFTDNKELTSKVELAWEQRENKTFSRLEAVAKMSLETCAETEDTLLKKLQNTTDLKATYRALSKNIHEHRVKALVLDDSARITNNLLMFTSQKHKETSLTKVIGVIKQEQEFLSALDGKLKYPKAHDTDLINSIKSASDNLCSGKFDKLAKFVSFLESNTKDHAPIISILKSNTDVTKTYNILLGQYHEKCINVMNKVVSTLDAGKSITLDNKKFDCSIKLLDYLSKNRNSEFFPHQELQKIQTKVIENRKELELSKSKGLELDL